MAGSYHYREDAHKEKAVIKERLGVGGSRYGHNGELINIRKKYQREEESGDGLIEGTLGGE